MKAHFANPSHAMSDVIRMVSVMMVNVCVIRVGMEDIVLWLGVEREEIVLDMESVLRMSLIGTLRREIFIGM